MSFRRAYLVGCLVLAVVCLLPIATNPGFYSNDELQLVAALRDGASWFDVHWYVQWDQLFYRPSGYALFATQLGLADGNPRVVHALSLLHHFANVALAALVFRRYGLLPRAALLLVLLPTITAGVAWAAAAYDRLLVTALLASAAALGRRERPGASALPWFLLALTAKETAVAFAPIAWLLVLGRGRRHRLLAGLITVLAVAFAATRTLAIDDPGAYRMAFDAEAPERLLRFLAFPFALDVFEPQQIWGRDWLLGLGGMLVLSALALARDRRAALVAMAALVAPLLPVSGLQRAEGHLTYSASVGLAVLLALSLGLRAPPARDAAPGCPSPPGPVRRRTSPWVIGVATVLVALLAYHARQNAVLFRLFGTALDNLVRVHATLDERLDAMEVTCADDFVAAQVRRYAAHLQHTLARPALRLVEHPTVSPHLHVDETGAVTRR